MLISMICSQKEKHSIDKLNDLDWMKSEEYSVLSHNNKAKY
jgi:hypothetical protein